MEKKWGKRLSESAGDIPPSTTSPDGPLSEGLTMVTYLPNELMAKILSYLPVKPLLRFKCVSKPWCSFIECRDYVKMHLKESIERQTNLGIMIITIRGNGAGLVTSYHSIDYDSRRDATATAVEIEEPLRSCLCGYGDLGTCNGLFCLVSVNQSILLWNPSTRRCQKLPGAPINLPAPLSMVTGLGYDIVNDDYKVELIAQRVSDDFFGLNANVQNHSPKVKTVDVDVLGSNVLVYSLKTNSWKRAKDLSSYHQFQRPEGIFGSGALHWVTSNAQGTTSYLSIFAFDFVEDKSYLLSPLYIAAQTSSIALSVLGGCLAILFDKPNDQVNVWAMKEYGKTNSWSKLFSVKQCEVIGGFNSFIPLIYSRRGKDVLVQVDQNKIMWFDLERNKFKDVSLRGPPSIFRARVYLQSLVRLDGDSMFDEKQKKQPPKQKKDTTGDFLSKGFKLVL